MPDASPALPPARFALTKIQPPRLRTDLVERQALLQALGRALRTRRLTLLLAPAGFGKTVALTQQLRAPPAGEPLSFAWISADENDHLQRFLECLGAAVEPYDPAWRMAPDALATLALSEHGLRDAASEFVNALAGTEIARGVLVVDDAHRIADPRVWTFLQAVLDHLPPAWGLVVASRVEPPLRLARMRAGDELSEFRQGDLRFDEAAVQALLSGAAAPDAARARELMERTDGWAAGLRLSLSLGARPAGMSLRPGDPASRHVFDYLSAEVLDEMPARLRDFLLRCSVLPEMSAARCAQVSGETPPQAAALLEQIERRGLFVSVLDAQDLTLRLHDLFRDFLEERLARDHADELPALLCRAAAGECDLSRAFGYLERAGAWDEAAQLLVDGGAALLAGGGAPSVEEMLAQFPAAVLARQPDLHLLKGLAAFNRYDWDGLLQAMQTAARLYAEAGREAPAAMARAYASAGLHHMDRVAEAEAQLAALRAMPLPDPVRADVCYISAWHEFSRERTEAVAPLLAELIDTLARLPAADRWNRCTNLSLLIGLPGLHGLLQRVVQQIALVGGESPDLARAGALHLRAMLALEQGDLAAAWHWAQRGDADDHWLGQPRLLSMHNAFIQVLMHALRGEAEACRAALDAARTDMVDASPPSHRHVREADLLGLAVRAAWILGDEALVRELDEALRRAANRFEWLGAARCRELSAVFIALLDGRLGEARARLEPLAADIDRHMFFPAVQARLMLAAVQLDLDAPDASAATLRPWLDEVLTSGLFGGGLMAGPAVLARLAGAPWEGRLGAGAVALLAKMAGLLGAGRPEPPRFRETQSEPGLLAPAAGGPREALLSARELEVLQRIAAGDSNKLIARAFALSPHTVKRHVANILDKTGTRTRGQAAAWYQTRR